MKSKKLFFLAGIILAALVVLLSLYYINVAAQQEVVGYIEERLGKQNIPVVEIKARGSSPHLWLEIIVRSPDEKYVDPILRHSVRREVVLARQRGYSIEGLSLIFLNPQGEQIYRAEMPVYLENILPLPSAKLDDRVTRDMVVEKLNPEGLSLVKTEVTTSDGIQTLSLRLVAPSLEIANQSLPRFMSSLRPLLVDLNTQGAQITLCKLELADEKGQTLLKYVLDLQLDTETWWQADGLTESWFPSPPAEADRMSPYSDDLQTGTPTVLPIDTETPTIIPTDTPTSPTTDTPISP